MKLEVPSRRLAKDWKTKHYASIGLITRKSYCDSLMERFPTGAILSTTAFPPRRKRFHSHHKRSAR